MAETKNQPETETEGPGATGTLEVRKVATGAVQISDLDMLVDLAREAAFPLDVRLNDEPQVIQIPEGSKAQVIDVTSLRPHYQNAPARRTGIAEPGTVDAFIDYVGDHQIAGVTTIWVPVTEGPIVAVFNDNGIVDEHGSETTGWGDHRAELRLTHTAEWEHWMSRHNQLGTQEEFADHLEEGMDDITDPAAADLMEIAQSIHGHSHVTFKNSRRDGGRVEFQISEESEAKGGAGGNMEIPTEFTIAMAPFVGEEKYKVKARIRYKISKNGELEIGYKLARPDAVLRDAFRRISDRFLGIERDDDGKENGRKEPVFHRVYLGEPALTRGVDSSLHGLNREPIPSGKYD